MEMLTTLIVLSILGGVAIPTMRSAIERADARKVVTDVSAIRVAVYQFREENQRLPAGDAWGTIPPELADYLNNVDFRYKDLSYRLVTTPSRGRVDVLISYPALHPVADALMTFARPGSESGSVVVTTSSARFRLLEDNQ